MYIWVGAQSSGWKVTFENLQIRREIKHSTGKKVMCCRLQGASKEMIENSEPLLACCYKGECGCFCHALVPCISSGTFVYLLVYSRLRIHMRFLGHISLWLGRIPGIEEDFLMIVGEENMRKEDEISPWSYPVNRVYIHFEPHQLTYYSGMRP